MKLDFMTRIKINKINESYYTVVATTRKFGRDQVMYEGISEKDCIDYIAKENSMMLKDPVSKDTMWGVYRDMKGNYYLAYFVLGTLISKSRKTKTEIEKFLTDKFG